MGPYDTPVQAISPVVINVVRNLGCDVPKLRTSIREANANARRYGTFQSPYALRPDDWIRASGACYCYNESKVPDDGVIDGKQDNVTDDDGGLDCLRQCA